MLSGNQVYECCDCGLVKFWGVNHSVNNEIMKFVEKHFTLENLTGHACVISVASSSPYDLSCSLINFNH